MVKWILVAAARPNFMKIAPLLRAIKTYNRLNGHRLIPYLVHTGQHYDYNMSEAFFGDLGIPKPDTHLGVGSGTHAEQSAKVMIAFEKVLVREKPALVIVVGDVNSTMACALTAVKLHIPVAHVEAGLRSFDRTMPEEINRIVTDCVSEYLFTPSPDGDKNLLREGISEDKTYLVGDIMVDSLLDSLEKAKNRPTLEKLGLVAGCNGGSADRKTGVRSYALLTLHRPANVDNGDRLSRILNGITRIAERIPVLFPVHPRTQKQVRLFGLENAFVFHQTPALELSDYEEGGVLKKKIHCFEPFGYLDFLNLMAHAKVILTDSGGIQQETTVMNIPCVTLRDTTERPLTISQGTNVLVNDDEQKIVSEVSKALNGVRRKSMCPAIWDGHTAERIVTILAGKQEE